VADLAADLRSRAGGREVFAVHKQILTGWESRVNIADDKFSCHRTNSEEPIMQVAIIGAGNVGRSLASSITAAGHAVRISSTDPADSASVAASTGAVAVESNAIAVAGANIVILAVPAASVPDVARALGTALDGKVVVDVANRPTPDPSGAPQERSLAEELQAAIPNALVVKAFNTAFASRQASPEVDGHAVDGYVAADDDAARAVVLELVDSIGFRAIDAGPLAVARTLEGMAWLNITLQLKHGWPWQSGWKLVGPTSKAA
jgi:predicted dinucleotide-binding enzyme